MAERLVRSRALFKDKQPDQLEGFRRLVCIRELHATTTEVPLNVLEAMKAAGLRANNHKYHSGVSKPSGSHANTSQSHANTHANDAQECFNFLEAM